MLTLPAGVQDALDQDETVFNTLIDLTVGATTYRLTDAPGQRSQGGNTYDMTGNIEAVTLPNDGGDISRSLYAMTLLDPDRIWANRFVSPIGLAVTVRVIFLLASGSFSAPLTVYKGKSIGMERAGIRQTVRFAGAFLQTDAEFAVVTSKENQDGRDINDNSMDFVGVAREVFWGREDPNRLRFTANLFRGATGQSTPLTLRFDLATAVAGGTPPYSYSPSQIVSQTITTAGQFDIDVAVIVTDAAGTELNGTVNFAGFTADP